MKEIGFCEVVCFRGVRTLDRIQRFFIKTNFRQFKKQGGGVDGG